MVDNVVKEWLSEFATLEKDDWTTFAITTSQNKTLIESIYAVLDDTHKYTKVNIINQCTKYKICFISYFLIIY